MRQLARALLWQLLYSGKASIAATLRYMFVNMIVAQVFRRKPRAKQRASKGKAHYSRVTQRSVNHYDNIQWHNVPRSNNLWSKYND